MERKKHREKTDKEEEKHSPFPEETFLDRMVKVLLSARIKGPDDVKRKKTGSGLRREAVDTKIWLEVDENGEVINRTDDYINLDVYLTGRLETEPEVIKASCLTWEKRPQKAYTERGEDSYVFVAMHPRGFELTVYPLRLLDVETDWAYRYDADYSVRHRFHNYWDVMVSKEGWDRMYDFGTVSEYPASSYMDAMGTARFIADQWKFDPQHPHFPVTSYPVYDAQPSRKGDLNWGGEKWESSVKWEDVTW
jgi:hypothetical protein